MPDNDCGCITHSGPHWLHMDRIWHENNQKMLRDGNLRGFLTEEIARLKEKEFHLSRNSSGNTGSDAGRFDNAVGNPPFDPPAP